MDGMSGILTCIEGQEEIKLYATFIRERTEILMKERAELEKAANEAANSNDPLAPLSMYLIQQRVDALELKTQITKLFAQLTEQLIEQLS